MVLQINHAITAVLSSTNLQKTHVAQEEPIKEGGVHSGADSGRGKTHRGGCSFWSLGLEEVRPEAYQGFSLSKVCVCLTHPLIGLGLFIKRKLVNVDQ